MRIGSSRVVIPYSGGIESMCLLAHYTQAGYDVYPLVFKDDDTEYANRKSAIVEGLLTFVNIEDPNECLYNKAKFLALPNSDVLTMKDGYIPGYKMLMATTALAYATKIGAKFVIFGNNKENLHQAYPDQSLEFFIDISKFYSRTYDYKITIINPFYKMSKDDVIRRYSSFVPLDKSVSCTSLTHTGTLHCGKCDSCYERKDAFDKARVQDPTIYESEYTQPRKLAQP